MELNKLRDAIHLNAKEKGFYDDDRPFNIAEKLMLITSELSEALEADRKNRYARMDIFLSKINTLNEVYSEKVIDSALKYFFEDHIKDTVEDELADALIRILDLCGALGIDIDKHVLYKRLYNSQRENKHGKKY
jgi:NTP pyrophosphatase (non-canonical NTP hydrolase)